jgi:alpha-tubulin suppressor-like RCC1 family protein
VFYAGAFLGQKSHTPIPLGQFDELDISCLKLGYSHMVVSDVNKSVYTVGDNKCGQCGIPSVIEKGTDYLNEKIQVSLPCGNVGLIAAGKDYTVFTDESRKILFVFGSNEKGQLGVGGIKNRDLPTKSVEFKSEIIEIVCSTTFTWIRLADSSICRFGSNNFGELGSGDDFQRSKPLSFDFLTIPGKIVKISSGMAHTCLLTDKGQIFVTGRGQEGQLGMNNKQLMGFKPMDISEKIVDISCGYAYTLALGESKTLYSFGNGLVKTTGGEIFQRSDTIDYVGKMLDQDVNLITSGPFHCLYRKTSGKFYSFGLGTDGQHGIGKNVQGHGPHQVPIHADISTFACGGHFSIFY